MAWATLVRMGKYWSHEECRWVEHVRVVVPEQVAASDDDAAAPAAEELVPEDVGLTA